MKFLFLSNFCFHVKFRKLTYATPYSRNDIISNFIIKPPSISLKVISAEIYHNYISLLNVVEKFSEFSICVLWENNSKRIQRNQHLEYHDFFVFFW